MARDSVFGMKKGGSGASSSEEGIPLTAEKMLDQARAALWLLRHYGGVGAKSRKGFGSLDDDPNVELSLEWCRQVAADLRQTCGFDSSPTAAYPKPYLGGVQLPATDCWWVLHELGFAAAVRQG